MSVVGAIIFCVVGILVLYVSTKIYKGNDNDYIKYPTAVGTVLGTEEFIGGRWIVSFLNEEGTEVLAMDDRFSASTFTPEKYHMPKRKNQEKVYYWKYQGNSQFGINGQTVEYYFHFCDEKLYELVDLKQRNSIILSRIIGVIIIVVGIAIFTFGNL